MNNPLYCGLSVFHKNGVTYGVEKIANIVDELRKMHREHWAETEVKYLNEGMDPNYAHGIEAEERGRIVTFTARRTEDHELIGNSIFIIGPSLHMVGKVVANEDTFYLKPECRGGSVAGSFIEYIKEALTLAGVHYMSMTDKSPVGGRSLERLMASHGLKRVAVVYQGKLES